MLSRLQRIRAKFLEGDPEATLCVEFYADDKQELPPKLAELEQDLRARNLGYAYRPETELQSHYLEARIAEQFDAIFHYDRTRAVEPLERTARWEA